MFFNILYLEKPIGPEVWDRDRRESPGLSQRQRPRTRRLCDRADISCCAAPYMPMKDARCRHDTERYFLGHVTMRVVAAILAMVMSVATGGPLRCPCQVLTLLKGDAPCVSHPPIPAFASDDDECCSCKSHHQKHESKSPNPEKKSPPMPPCQHGPGIDLPPPGSSAERLAGDHELEAAVGLGCESSIPVIARLLDLSRVEPSDPFASPLHALKYCFAFRC